MVHVIPATIAAWVEARLVDVLACSQASLCTTLNTPAWTVS